MNIKIIIFINESQHRLMVFYEHNECLASCMPTFQNAVFIVLILSMIILSNAVHEIRLMAGQRIMMK